MPKAQIKYSDEFRAIEAFSVLMQKKRPSRSYTKAEIIADLTRPQVYGDFLKLCIEQDKSAELSFFKKGILLVLKSIGITKASNETGLSRISIYRMFATDGNPELKSLLSIYKFLGLKMWVVDNSFISAGSKIERLKSIPLNAPRGGGRKSAEAEDFLDQLDKLLGG